MRSPSSKHKKLSSLSTDSNITNRSPKSSLAGLEGDYVNHIKPSSRHVLYKISSMSHFLEKKIYILKLSQMNQWETFRQDTIEQLDYYYGLVKRQLLRYQSPTSHLFPAKSSNTEHASIRDSIYCSAAVWSLYQVSFFLFSWHMQICILA